MIDAVDLFNGGEALCTKTVRSDFRMDITARLWLPIELSEEIIFFAFPNIFSNY